MTTALTESLEDKEQIMRRGMDKIFTQRLTAISATINRMQETLEKRIEEITEIQRMQAALIERISGINERFAIHDRQESEDRKEILGVMNQITQTLAIYGQEIKGHGEAIGALKRWDLLLATALATVASSGVWWLIHLIQTIAAK